MARLFASNSCPRIHADDRESLAWIRAYSQALFFAALSVISLVGCGGPTNSGGTSTLDAMAEKLNQKAVEDKQTAKQQAAVNAQASADAKAAEAARLANQGGSKVRPEDMQRGSKMVQGGYLQTVLKGGVRAEQRLNLFVVQDALNKFWGFEGRYPKDHDEFMEKVIELNGIELEPLQEPYEYFYNAEDHQLYKVAKQEAVDAANAEAEAAQVEADRAAEAAKQ